MTNTSVIIFQQRQKSHKSNDEKIYFIVFHKEGVANYYVLKPTVLQKMAQ